MMFLKIYCGSCGQSWEVYWRDNWKSTETRTCPHCGAQVDRQTWGNQVIPAFGRAIDADMELTKDHSGGDSPLFRFDVISTPKRN